MCEIAILRPAEYSPVKLKEVAMELYESMRSSLGVVAVYNKGDHFDYSIYKSINPEREALLNFVETEHDAHRLIIHGRLATQGAVTVEHQHPLEVDCPECDVDYVIHNGVVHSYTYEQRQHISDGHEYSTEVDSEVIAHNYGSVPTDFDGGVPEHHDHQPSFILMNDDAIFIHGSRGYHLTEYATMTRTHRSFGPVDSQDDYQRVIMTPTEDA
jgi:predicted glutamine amidotransferase